ncbi:hypothetical protein E0Z10_g4019 [Xylaria hypoxylon]|uniref:Siderophore biosynthesis enzyme n=1 Tax=Xylaria hypoxylon TaxID=37992 RepID=A0A4Z0Z1V9_9PEZI|nr:hypothetical protein E0Z10_g4019 [Xylaria hypoxylon]
MFIRTSSALVAAALLAGHAAAKTNIAGCVSSQTVAYGGASLIWYVPDTGEICEFLDCGGGRAPPKTTVPGCPSYEGTATYSPSYLPGFGAVATSTSSSAGAVATESSASDDSSSSESASTSASENASITSPPVTTTTATATSSGAVQTQTGSTSETASSSSSSSSAADSAATESSTSSVSAAGAALPTAAVKGVFGVLAGIAAGVAML